ncbi:MAG TPA: Asp-tRNA(Asn)/Glu-tRNA(Gln) amidotransferase subunit GatA, partial [Pseudobdellovibrionaceae bacterium]
MDLIQASIVDIADAVKAKKVSAKEITTQFIKRAESINPKLNAYTSFNNGALQDAEAIDARIAKGEDAGVLA